MSYYARYGETSEKAAEKHISIRKEIAAKFPAVREIIRKFDGKVYNRRFSDAIRETGLYCHYYKERQSIDIYSYDRQQITIIYYKLPENKRLSADDLLTALDDKYSVLMREVTHMTELMPRVEDIREKIRYTQKLLESVLADLSYEEMNIFDLHYQVRKV